MNSLNDERPYLVPRAVRTRFEFTPGFGIQEFVATVLGGGAGLVLQFLWNLLPLHSAPLHIGARMMWFIMPPAAAYMITKPDLAGRSILDDIRAARSFRRRTHRFLYRRERP